VIGKDGRRIPAEGLRLWGELSLLRLDDQRVCDPKRGTLMYGQLGTSIEQVNNSGTVSYLHHDQAGSTRLLTGSTGTVTGKCTYTAYGAPTYGYAGDNSLNSPARPRGSS
jgi:hypothetical protein